MRFSRRGGFTLIELMMALSLTGLTLLGGILLLDGIGDSATRITKHRVAAARDANGAWLLRRFLLDAIPSADTTHGLRGDERSAEFWTFCDATGGWSEPCKVSLVVDWQRDSSNVLADLSTGGSFALLRGPGHFELRYVDVVTDSVWTKRWAANLTLPRAVVLVNERDTVVFPIASHG